MTSKQCKLCDLVKPVDQFPKHNGMSDGYLNQCKSCKSAYHREYRANNPELLEKKKAYYEANKDDLKAKVRNRWHENATENNRRRRERYETDSEYRESVLRVSRESNARHRSERRRTRRETDEAWRLEQICRNRMWNALNGKATKCDRTVELLGCTGEELLEYLEKTKVPEKDYSGDLHIDHIIPCSSFDFTDPEEQRKCFHYTNLQWLPAKENLRKSNKCTNS